jgi:preprotein translocase subunit SecB
MEIKEQAELRFEGVDIPKVHYQAKKPPKGKLNVEIGCTPSVFYPNDDTSAFRIVMDVEIKSENFFILQLRAIGNFNLSEEITEELKKKFVNSNAPAIMFPYIRSFVSMFTSNLGQASRMITIPTHLFNGDLEEFKKDADSGMPLSDNGT